MGRFWPHAGYHVAAFFPIPYCIDRNAPIENVLWRASNAHDYVVCRAPQLRRQLPRRWRISACEPHQREGHALRHDLRGWPPQRNGFLNHAVRRGNRARGEAISEGHRRNRSWAREHPSQRDDAWFEREIAPKLDAFTLREIADATGLSLAACSRIRAGGRVPHPRHWRALAALVEGSDS